MSTVNELAVKAKQDNSALLPLWESVKGFARYKARQYSSKACMDDLLQSAFEALYGTLRAFDASRYEFITLYAFHLRRAFKAVINGAKASDPLNSATSLDAPLSSDEESLTLGDTIEDANAQERFADAERDELAQALTIALGALTEQERQIIHARYLCDLTRSETAQKLCVSDKEVLALESSALRKLRHPANSKALRKYL